MELRRNLLLNHFLLPLHIYYFENDMTLRANVNTNFLRKFLLIGLVCSAFGAWGMRDLIVKVPEMRAKAVALEELKKEANKNGKGAAWWTEEWRTVAIKKGWVTQQRIPNDAGSAYEPTLTANDGKQVAKSGYEFKAQLRPEKTPSEVNDYEIYQYVYIVLGFGIGLPYLFLYFRNRGSWVETTKAGLRSSFGQELAFDQVAQFDKKKWEKKGIGVLTYEQDGRDRRFVLDDLKFDRKPMDQIVELVEEKIGIEKIINGIPEKQDSQKIDASE